MRSLNRSRAGGRESVTLADAIARNKPNRPSICHKGNMRAGWAGSGAISGRVTGTADVVAKSISVGMSVADGVIVDVEMGAGVRVAVDVVTNGMSMIPSSLSHRS